MGQLLVPRRACEPLGSVVSIEQGKKGGEKNYFMVPLITFYMCYERPHLDGEFVDGFVDKAWIEECEVGWAVWNTNKELRDEMIERGELAT